MKTSQFLLSVIIILCLFLLPYTASAQDQSTSCPSYPDVPVHIINRFDTPNYDYTQTIPTLMGQASDTHHSIHESIPLGLTRYRPLLSIRLTTKTMDIPEGLTCIYVEHVDVTLGYQDVIVFIANEVPPQSCGFQEVLAHEQKHIAVNQKLLEEYSPLIEARLKDYLKLNGVFREPDPQYATTLVHDGMQGILEDIMNDFHTENTRRQQRVDSHEEYQRLGLVCNGQLSAIAHRYQITGQ